MLNIMKLRASTSRMQVVPVVSAQGQHGLASRSQQHLMSTSGRLLKPVSGERWRVWAVLLRDWQSRLYGGSRALADIRTAAETPPPCSPAAVGELAISPPRVAL